MVGVEQMYSPHQIPWTVEGARTLLNDIYQRGGSPFYITIDTGHQSGQRRFLKPDAGKIRNALHRCRAGLDISGLWLGPQMAYERFRKGVAHTQSHDKATIRDILAIGDQYPYLFAQYHDGDPYRWLGELGAWSPIVHLQQTDGRSSGHWAFTKERNISGIITPEKVISALKVAYARPEDPLLPPRISDIYLTFEMFSATADINTDIITRLEETVAYWRQAVPMDGMELGTLA